MQGAIESAPMAGSGATSRVVFFRNLSYEAKPEEIVQLFVAFNPVKLLHLPHKGQAFIEFGTPLQAQQVVDYACTRQVSIAGRSLKASKSTTNDTLNHGQILQIAPGGTLPGLDRVISENAGVPTNVVVLNIFNTQLFPVTLEAIHTLTSYIGPVNRIILFDKDGHTNALVEYQHLEHAVKAQKVLYRHHLWNNQMGLILTAFSKQSQLIINHTNASRAWDYTAAASQMGGMPPQPPSLMAPYQSASAATAIAGQQQIFSQPQQVQQHQLHQQLQMQQQQQQQHQQQLGLRGPGGAATSTLLLSGLDKGLEAVTWIFNLMGFWGNVVRVKFIHKKDNVAMVEYSSPEECQNALRFSKGIELFHKPLRASLANFPSIQIGATDQYAKDFSTSKQWRYVKGAQSNNYAQVCPPGTKLHLAYLHGYTEEEIRTVFARFGRVISFQFTPDNPTMGYLVMETINDACTSLACLHNRPNPSDPSSHPLRVSFTRA